MGRTLRLFEGRFGRLMLDELAAGDRIEALEDPVVVLQQRYDARPGTVYLIRPDQHVAARWRSYDEARVRQAMARCLGR